MEHMTELTRERFECALQISNCGDAARALLDYGHFRTLGDVLHTFSQEADLKKTLVDGLLLWFPDKNQSSLERNVRNWLNGRVQSLRKEDAFILSHILGLDLEQTNDFLKYTAGEGIHWRDPEDIVWSYSILHRLEPTAVRALLNRAVNQSGAPAASAASSYTAAVYEKLQPVLYRSEEELLAFLRAERENLGVLHNTAYQTFDRYITLLENGFSDDDVESLFLEMTQAEKKKKASDAAARRETARLEAAQAGTPFDADAPGKRKTLADLDGDTELYQPEPLSSRDILETYLYRSLVPVGTDKSSKKLDPFYVIRQSIRQTWPDEFTISRMKNRQIDISRKVLILLFLATDGSASDYDCWDDEEEQYTQDDAFLDIYTRLNLMLTSCGFLKLDPRSAFDWMILFCISTGDLWESDERIQTLLNQLFPVD